MQVWFAILQIQRTLSNVTVTITIKAESAEIAKIIVLACRISLFNHESAF